MADRGRIADVPASRRTRSLRHRHCGCAPRRDRQGRHRAAAGMARQNRRSRPSSTGAGKIWRPTSTRESSNSSMPCPSQAPARSCGASCRIAKPPRPNSERLFHESTAQQASRRAGNPGARRHPGTHCGPGSGAGRGARLRSQFSGSPDHSGSLSVQAAASIFARIRVGRSGRCGGRGRRAPARRRSRAAVAGARRHGREGGRARRQLLEDSGCHAVRRSGRAAHDLRHFAARAQGPGAIAPG